MAYLHHILVSTLSIFLVILSTASLSSSSDNASENSFIYTILEMNGLPKGLLPNGIENYYYDPVSKELKVYFDRDCYVTGGLVELRYDTTVSGKLGERKIEDLSGVSLRKNGVWAPVHGVWMEYGLIIFSLRPIETGFPLEVVETPKDCKANLLPKKTRVTEVMLEPSITI